MREPASTLQERVPPSWYYPGMGLIAGAGVVASAGLNQPFAGLSLMGAAIAIGVLGVFARGGSRGFRSPSMNVVRVVYLVLVGVVLVGSLVGARVVVRPNHWEWLAWVLGFMVFLVLCGGAWVMRPSAPR